MAGRIQYYHPGIIFNSKTLPNNSNIYIATVIAVTTVTIITTVTKGGRVV